MTSEENTINFNSDILCQDSVAGMPDQSNVGIFSSSIISPIYIAFGADRIPMAMESKDSLDLLTTNMQMQQVLESDYAKELLSEARGDDKLTKIRDSDGDGIPDGDDKDPDQSTANVAAKKLKIGKFSKKEMRSTFSSLLKGMKKLLSLAGNGDFFASIFSLFGKKSKKGGLALEDKDDDDTSLFGGEEQSMFGTVKGKDAAEGNN
ncbi:MAG: hypothetical protein LBI56_02190 [Puniceicoccales bacterium]|jgi:hypothetical protein|nr:hypothetical protein [Puniceicoccales bacterium]